MIVTLNEQTRKSRYILHMLHYIPNKIAEEILTIEDIIPLYNVKVRINVSKTVKSVKMVPENIQLEFTLGEDNCIEFVIPEIKGHNMVELSY